MKRLLILFTVGLLAGCGGVSTPSVPSSPVYPQLEGSFTDLRSGVSACTEFVYRKAILRVTEQQGGDLYGNFLLSLSDGTMTNRVFSGSVTTAGDITGSAGTGEGEFRFDLEAIGNDYIGGEGWGKFAQCPDGSYDRLEMILSMER